jgi:peptidoglycan biosynthesis protein MviN/MurJ (putative lipid II flippase)
VNAGLNCYFVFWLKPQVNGHAYLALSTAVVALTNCVILYITLTRISSGLEGGLLAKTLLRLILPLAAIGAVCFAGMSTILHPLHWAHYGFILRCLTLGAVIGLAAGAYFLSAGGLGVGEARQFLGMAKRRLNRKK